MVHPLLVSVKKCPLSQRDEESTPEWDEGQCPSGCTRAREAGGVEDALPACLAELTEPDDTAPIGAHDDESSEVQS